MQKSIENRHIDLVAYEGAQFSAILGLEDLFLVANRISAKENGPQIRPRQIDPTNPPTDTAIDAVIVPPNLSGKRGSDHDGFHDWLCQRHQNGTVISSVCAGAFWLAECGLLNGRKATTHWALEDEFRTAFPKVDLQATELLIDNHDIVTAGGVMAWLDMGLYFVHRWQGPAVMGATARHLLVDPAGRAQKNYRSFRPPINHGNQAILAVQHWLEQHVADDFTIANLAKQAHMSGRSFLRHFTAATGLAPNRYIQLLRIEKARALLERSNHPVNDIAWRCGYQDPATFGRLFREVTGITPGEYRKRFGVHPEQMSRKHR